MLKKCIMLLLCICLAMGNAACSQRGDESDRPESSSGTASESKPESSAGSGAEPGSENTSGASSRSEQSSKAESVPESSESESAPDYGYDAATEILFFPKLDLQCRLPANEMKKITIAFENLEMPGEAVPGGNTVLNRINFLYKTDNSSYLMFSFTRWEAAEWDAPKPATMLPDEVARSEDGEWVVVHSLSSLAAEPPRDSAAAAGFWECVKAAEESIASSLDFALC